MFILSFSFRFGIKDEYINKNGVWKTDVSSRIKKIYKMTISMSTIFFILMTLLAFIKFVSS